MSNLAWGSHEQWEQLSPAMIAGAYNAIGCMSEHGQFLGVAGNIMLSDTRTPGSKQDCALALGGCMRDA